jgi:L-proline---[L-prolyl-carrier protein] ligase
MAFLLNQLLCEGAVSFPDKDALFCQERSITYSTLERESNKIANELVALGVKRGSCVGIYMRRGIDSIVAAFGIMKAGGTYVPIDPMSPSGRMQYIVKKCGMKFIVTVREKIRGVYEVFPESLPFGHILIMDGLARDSEYPGRTRLIDCKQISNELGGSAPDVAIIDSDLAYILFTSGSTGEPKGVMISHLNSLTFVNAAYSFFNINEEDRFSNIAPLHFDMSILDIFVALRGGASVVIIPESVALFPVKLAELIAQHRISVWNSVPSALCLLANANNLEDFDFSSLRLVLFAGEVFPMKYLRRLQKVIPQAKFCNMYGQTEANSSTYYWVESRVSNESGPLPIGRPLPNFEVFALDEGGKEVVVPGQEGELYVRASSVALGYLGDDDRTRKCFVRNPLRPDLDERIYRTGDLVHLEGGGNYVFSGRKDHMIKSRGYRIEIGEIETVLSNHPDIKSSVVIPIPDELVGNRISAILVPLTPNKIEKEDILRYCSKRLPKYMIPEIIEFRDSLPTTSSGKIDRKELSAPK